MRVRYVSQPHYNNTFCILIKFKETKEKRIGERQGGKKVGEKGRVGERQEEKLQEGKKGGYKVRVRENN